MEKLKTYTSKQVLMMEAAKHATPAQIDRALALIDELSYTEDFHVSLSNVCLEQGYEPEEILRWLPRELVQELISYLRKTVKASHGE